MNASILIVDDEPNIRRMLGALLREEGYATSEAGDGKEAVQRMSEVDADVVLLDLALPGVTGLDLLDTIHSRWPLAPIIMMSGRASLSDAVASADTVVITKRWPGLEGVVGQLRDDQRVVDLVGLDGADALGPERYAGIGW